MQESLPVQQTTRTSDIKLLHTLSHYRYKIKETTKLVEQINWKSTHVNDGAIRGICIYRATIKQGQVCPILEFLQHIHANTYHAAGDKNFFEN